MRSLIASRIMPRTTLDLDPIVLQELKRRRSAEGKTLGELASELLASAFAREPERGGGAPFEWTSKPMGARIDLDDDEAVRRALGDA